MFYFPFTLDDCMYNNGGCEQLCLVSGHLESYRCACRYGMILDEDQRSCVSSGRYSD